MEIFDVKAFKLGELYVCTIDTDSVILEYVGNVSNHKPEGQVYEKMHFIVRHHLKYDEYVPEVGEDLSSTVEDMQRGILVKEICFRTLTAAEQVLYGVSREVRSDQTDKTTEERLENDTSAKRTETNPLPLILEARRLSAVYRLPTLKRRSTVRR